MKKLNFLVMTVLSLFIWTSCNLDDLDDVDKPKANFTYSPSSPIVGQEVQFTSTSKNADDYEWDFGDGETSDYENPEHTYITAGSYTVKLTVLDDGNLSNSISKVVVVSPAPVGSIIEHDEDIKNDEVWSNQYLHVVKREIEVIDATLTIEPGTKVVFNDDAGLVFGYSSNVSHSKLVAQGTPDKHIIFTTNSLTTQQPNWRWIYFGSSASHESIMEYCDISYGGTYSSNSGSVEIRETSIIFNNNTVTHSAAYGVYCGNDGSFESFTNNVIAENMGSSMVIKANYAHTLGENNTIANTKNGIEIKNDVDMPGDFLWRNHGAKYTIVNNINIGSANGSAVTIEEGTTIAFKEDYELSIGYDENKSGKLTAVGTPEKPIRFVSAKTNSSAGDWDYIYFGKYNDPTSKMEYCEIDAGGGFNATYSGAIVIYETQIAFNHNKVTNSNSNGISFQGYSPAYFTSCVGNVIENSARSSIRISSNWAHTIGENNIIAHDSYGIEVRDDFNHNNKSFTWLKQTCPYTIMNSVEIGSAQGCSLTIAPGTTVQIAEDYELTVGYSDNVSGTLIAEGTPDEKITFTSATPTGSFDYLYFGQGTMPETVLNNCIINNGGDYASYNGAISCSNINTANAPTIKNCHISNSKSNGIYINNSTPVLENNTFENNAGEDIKYNS